MTTINRTSSISFNLKNIEFHYPRLGQPHIPTFGGIPDGAQYTVQVRGIDEESLMKLEALGVPLKELEDGSKAIQLKAYVDHNNFTVVDGDKQVMTAEQRAMIGSGSKGHVACYTYTNKFGATAVRMTILAVTEQVDHVERTLEDRISDLVD